MKQKIIPITAAVVWGLCFSALPAQAQYGGGSGTAEDPYLIYTAEQMNEIGLNEDDWGSHFKLMADIDLSEYSGTAFNIIGYFVDWDDNKPFTGIFDGNGHTISNFSYNSTGTDNIGIFGYVSGANAEIKNLGLIDPDVDAGTENHVGSLVGYLRDGIITGCCVEGGSVSGNNNLGALVGYNNGTITNSYTTGSVSGGRYVGGLVGTNSHGTITNCYSSGDVSGVHDVGGLVGVNNNYGTITNCYSTGSVSGDQYAGGLVGINLADTINSYATGSTSGDRYAGGLVGGNTSGTITNCYATGSVSGDEYIGGLVGLNKGTVFASFWDIQTSGQANSDGGTGLPTDKMQTQSTFIDAGWVCGSVWTIDEGVDYPRLWWENKPGEPLTPPSYEGRGTEADPYLIYTAEELNTIGLMTCDWDKHFKLMADIDLISITETSFNIIGIDSYNPFSGVFDGNGHVISNFSYASSERNYIGLFGYVKGENTKIKDLGLINPNVNAGTRVGVGSLAGYLSDGTITDCYVEGGSVEGHRYIGGLVGSNGSYDGVCTITNCYSTVSISANEFAGGLVGYNPYGKITRCYSTGSVSGDYTVGGLVGWNYLGTITNSYSSGSVSGNEYVGGLVGWNLSGIITNCYSTGSVFGTADVGGLVGYGRGQVTGCFWDTETSGQLYSAGGTGLTTAEMKMTNTFFGWWCEPVWTIDEGVDYPRLFWENKPGELIAAPSDLYGGGSGEANDPYLIYTAEQLNTIGSVVCDWDKNFKLMADIDLSDYIGAEFNIIGIGYYECSPIEFCYIVGTPFTGTFDGNGHTISNFTYDSNGINGIGLFGYFGGVIKDLGLINPNVDAGTGNYVGSLVGYLNGGTVTGCYAEGGSVWGGRDVGGLAGMNGQCPDQWCYSGTISNCYSTASVSGGERVGGLVGWNVTGTITNCSSTGSVSGVHFVGGLVGRNYHNGTITNSYSTGSVSGVDFVGGLVGGNSGTITNCFSTDKISGNYHVGGLVGDNYKGMISTSFWDIETSGQDWSDGGTGLPTAEMQMKSTFTDAGWDFNTPVWTIDEGVDYPRLWWEYVPVLYAEPEVTLGTSNVISWEPVVGDVEYYAECAEDANFNSIIYNSGWITETSYEFTGLELGKRYWYSVKARNSAGVESQWSNVESSLQCTLAEAIEIMLDPNNLKSENLKKPLINKINIAQDMIEKGIYTGALSKLENDILLKTDGCVETGEPDKSDWVITCEEQDKIYPLVTETIEYVKSLME